MTLWLRRLQRWNEAGPALPKRNPSGKNKNASGILQRLPSMSGIIPNRSHCSTLDTDARPVCEWVMPVVIPKKNYARTCKALPSGMPTCLEVCVIHSEEGTERTTTAVYGRRVYLIHYEFTPRYA
jgi:hypothetical protein